MRQIQIVKRVVKQPPFVKAIYKVMEITVQTLQQMTVNAPSCI